jgi:hypothetical protein
MAVRLTGEAVARRVDRSWDESDAYTKWRHYLKWRPGQIARIKRRTHRRERREGRREVRDQLDYLDVMEWLLIVVCVTALLCQVMAAITQEWDEPAANRGAPCAGSSR